MTAVDAAIKIEYRQEDGTAGTSRQTPGRPTRQKKTTAAKILEDFQLDADDDVVTDAASEADEVLMEEQVEGGAEEEEEEDSDSDDDEGTYFIDQTGNYYYQATPDSEPVLSTPPKGKYIPDDDEGSE